MEMSSKRRIVALLTRGVAVAEHPFPCQMRMGSHNVYGLDVSGHPFLKAQLHEIGRGLLGIGQGRGSAGCYPGGAQERT